jgi:hypothetical protein
VATIAGANQKGATNHLLHFNIASFVWTYVRSNGLPPAPRCGHGSTLLGNDMLVFGGFSEEIGYSSGEFRKIGLFFLFFSVMSNQLSKCCLCSISFLINPHETGPKKFNFQLQ